MLSIIGVLTITSFTSLMPNDPGTDGLNHANQNLKKYSNFEIQSSLQSNSYLTLDYNVNPGFEETDAYGIPTGYDGFYGTSHSYTNFSYSEMFTAGANGCLIQSQGTNSSSGGSYISRYWGTSRPLSDGFTLDFDCFLKTMNNGDNCYLQLQINNGVNYYRLYYYYYLEGSVSSNSTSSSNKNYYFDVTKTTGTWHHITLDMYDFFENELGVSTSGYFVNQVQLYTYSPRNSSNMGEIVVDEFYINSTTDENFCGNSDFESSNSWWSYNNQSPGLISTTSESFTEGSQAVNITCAAILPNSYSYLYMSEYLSSSVYRKVISADNKVVVDFKWKYKDAADMDSNQRAVFYMSFGSESAGYYYLYFILGQNNDEHTYTNTTNNKYIYLAEFGSRGEWVHTIINLYDYIQEFGWYEFFISEVYFEIYTSSMLGSYVEFLLDEYHLYMNPLFDPGFEQTFYSTSLLTSWGESTTDENVLNVSKDSHLGKWAVNMTVDGQIDAAIYNYGVFGKFTSGIYTDFWWRLDDFEDTSGYVDIYLNFGSRNLHYIIGNGTSQTFTNSSNDCYILLHNRNIIGSWQNLEREVFADLTNAFGLDSWILNCVYIRMYAGNLDRISVLLDDLNFIEKDLPEIHTIDLLNSPKYYENTLLQVHTTDANSTIDDVSVFYRTDTTWTEVHGILNVTIADHYDFTIPMLPFGTIVEYYIESTDSMGNVKIDNNAGIYYRYTSSDDIKPVVSLQMPFNNSIVTGDVYFKAQATDVGSDIAYVEFYLDLTLIGNDSMSPYDFTFDTRTLQNEKYNLEVIAYDNGGNHQELEDEITIFLENDFSKPSLSNILLNSTDPQAWEDIMASISVFDDNSIANASLFYRVDEGTWITVSMSNIYNLYQGIIPSFDTGTRIDYYIEIWDNLDQMSSAGNATNPNHYIVTDSINPDMQVIGPYPDLALSGDINLFLITGSDTGSDLNDTIVILNGTEITLDPSDSIDTWKFNWDTTGYANGEYSIIFRLYDSYGNYAEETYIYEINNPEGIINKSIAWADNFIRSYYGMAVGAGGMGILIISGILIIHRIKKKKGT